MMNESNSVVEFYRNKTIFVTGATGFLGKVLVEKLLRDCDVKKIYVLIRSKKGIEPLERLKDYTEHLVFDCLKKQKPNFSQKLKVVGGDMTIDGLNLCQNDENELIETCEIVIHCAANVRFDQTLKQAVNFNTCGTHRLLKLAERMQKLKVFSHVSTAYCQCNESQLEERFYPAPENPYGVIEMTQLLKEDLLESITPKLLNGLPNTYALSKALSEDLVHSYKEKFPIAISRPSIVTSSLNEPFPGFIEGVNGPTGLMIASSRGVLRSMHCNPDYNCESIPVDITANAILTATWKRAQLNSTEVFYCNVTESGVNPMTWGDAIEKGKRIFYEYPLSFALWYVDGSIKRNYFHHLFCVVFFHYLPAYFIDFMLMIFRQKPFLVRVQDRISQGLKVLQYYTTKDWIFKNENFIKLYSELGEREKSIFYFDMKEIDWDNYLKDYVLGIRHYLLKEKPETLPKARAVLKRLYYLDRVCKAILCWGLLYLLYHYVFSKFL